MSLVTLNGSGYAPQVGVVPLELWEIIAKKAADLGTSAFESAKFVSKLLMTCRTLNEFKLLPLFANIIRAGNEPRWVEDSTDPFRINLIDPMNNNRVVQTRKCPSLLM